jgi:hypothetical protein
MWAIAIQGVGAVALEGEAVVPVSQRVIAPVMVVAVAIGLRALDREGARMQTKKVLISVGCALALWIVGRAVYLRSLPNSEAQGLRDAASEIDRRLDEMKK